MTINMRNQKILTHSTTNSTTNCSLQSKVQSNLLVSGDKPT